MIERREYVKQQIKRRLKKVLIASAAALVILGFGLYTLSLGFRVGYEFHKGSYAYYVLMPKNMREIPTVGHVKREPVYRHNMADGEVPMFHSLIFETDMAPKGVEDFYRAYFSRQGLPPVNAKLWSTGEPILKIQTKDGYYEIYTVISKSAEGAEVDVTFYEEL